MELLLAYTLCFGSVVAIGVATYTTVTARATDYLRQRSTEATEELSDMFLDLPRHRVWMGYAVAPLATALVMWLLTESWVMAVFGIGFGFLVPKLMLGYMRAQRRKKFYNQLVDALLILSSSLKAGLSMLQAFAVVAEEMPPPISQEFGLMLKQTRMGISLDEAINNLKRRNPSDDVNLMATAVMVSRETGGDVTSLFTRLVETLRERKKLKERIKTLTFVSKIQGLVMGLLPIVFTYVIYNINRSFFEWFLSNPLGRMMLAGVILIQTVVFFLFLRFSRSPL